MKPAVSERSESNRPPLLGRVLLRLAPRRLHEAIAGDLEEMWQEGQLTRLGYMRAVVRSLADIFRLKAEATGSLERTRSRGFRLRAEGSSIAHDVRFGLRMMRRNPGVTLAAVTTLAIGIGGSTAIFSTVNPTLFRSLPYPASDRLVSLCDRGQDGSCLDVTYGTYRELLARSHAFDSLAVTRLWQPVLAESDQAERLDGQRVTPSYFRVLGVQPALGRGLTDADDALGAPRVAILSDGLWRRRFGADASILGREIPLGAARYAVIGIMPRSFDDVLAPDAEVWTALQYDPALPPDGREWGHHLRLVGRLRDGVSLAAMTADVDAIARAPLKDFPRMPWASMAQGFIIAPLQDALTRDVRPALLAFAAAVLLVLTIACANVANLLLARAIHRRREFAMRAALGAGRWRLTRQLLIEGLLIALPGGILGVIAARITVGALIVLAPAGLPRLDRVSVDREALAFAFAITTIIGIAIALLPAAQAFAGNLQRGLQHNTRTMAGGHRAARQVLVVTEVALALVLLVGAGLLFRSLRELVAIAPGFNAEHVVAAQVQTAGTRFQDDAVSHQFFTRALEAVEAIPGVSRAAITSQLPLAGQVERFGVFVEQAPSIDPNADGSAYRYAVSPGYFEAMRIPLRRGRALEARDTAAAPFAVVISETLARRRFAGIDPLGKRIRIGPDNGPWYTVVGIAADVKHAALSADDGEAVYVTPVQWFFADPARWIVVRSTAMEGVPAAIRAAVRSVDPGQPVVRMTSMGALLSAASADRRFALLVFVAFGGIALVLAVTGLYGALARNVTERTREIGVRAALGASRGEIVLMILRQGAAMTGIGVLLGLAGASAATRLLQSLLFGTAPVDPATYATVVAIFAVVSALASIVPAARAVAIDPAITLRAE